MSPDPAEVQRSFYAAGQHAHLRPRREDFYAAKLVGRMAREIGLAPHHRVLELGAGFGRFTFHLLEHCHSVLAVDLSQRALAELRRARGEQGVPEERCRVACHDVDALPENLLDAPVDFAVGFFFLHHLQDFGASIARVAPLVAPGGGLAFLEPNRRNPAFLVQIAACRDMSWSSEKGLLRLSGRAVARAYEAAGLTDARTRAFGLFPPQLHNRFAAARRLEARLETLAPLRPLLPFLLLTARAPEGRASP